MRRKLLVTLVLSLLILMLCAGAQAASLIDIGTCGNNITWGLFDDGTLSFSGSGAMYDYSQTDMPPWYENRGVIEKVIFSDDITHIGDNAFYDFTGYPEYSKLTSVTLPAKLESIGNYAFSWCKNLKNLQLPSSLKSIGSHAFSKCENLPNLQFPASLETIGFWAFNGCYGLTEVVLPSSLETIGSSAFVGCINLKSIYLPQSLKSID